MYYDRQLLNRDWPVLHGLFFWDRWRLRASVRAWDKVKFVVATNEKVGF
jgi:hypothetical protein